MKTNGAAGLSGLDAYVWRRLCSSFKSASKYLCSALAAVGRRLCTDSINPDHLSAFVACRLIPLDKSPGVRPIGIGEVPRRIIAKAILRLLQPGIWTTSSLCWPRAVVVRQLSMLCVEPSLRMALRVLF